MFDIFDPHRLLVVLINTIGIWLLVVVFLSSWKKREGKIFGLMTVAMLGWVNFAYFARVVDSASLSILFLKIAWFVTPPYFLFIHYFTLIIYKVWEKYKAITIVLTVICLLLSFVTGFTNLIIANRVIVDGQLAIEYGVAMWPFLIGVSLMIFSVVGITIKENPNVEKKEKEQLRPFILGLLVFYVANMIFNILMPIFLGKTANYYFGDYSTIILTSLIAYSIMRHNFLGARVFLVAFLVSVIGMLLIVDMFVFSDSIGEGFIKGIMFIVFVAISVMLLRSTLNEIRQKRLLEDLAREQKDIIDVMGHEIRTPLTAIVQELNLQKQIVMPNKEQWLKGEVSQEEREKMLGLIFESFSTIDKASTHAVSIVNTMLETARLDKGRFELNYDKFDLIDEISSSVEVMEKTADPERFEMSFESKVGEKYEVEADKSRLKEAVINLISNAIKYSDPEKKVSKIATSISSDDGSVIISVKDNGIGIKAEDINKLGKKFMRLNAFTEGKLKRPGGTGLGLFVVKGIIEHHGGVLLIESEGLGKGSTFTLKFPRYRKNS